MKDTRPEYETYSRGIAFYDEDLEKIVISPIVKKYPRVHDHLIKHEKAHTKYRNNNFKGFIYNLIWVDYRQPLEWVINPCLLIDYLKCIDKYNKIEDKKIYQEIKYIKNNWSELYNKLHPNTLLGKIVSIFFYLFIFLAMALTIKLISIFI